MILHASRERSSNSSRTLIAGNALAVVLGSKLSTAILGPPSPDRRRSFSPDSLATMKICFLAHARSIHTRRWVEYFRDRGQQVSVVSFTPADPMPGVDLHYLRHSFRIRREHTNWHYLLQLPRLWQRVREIKPDLLNAHFLSSYGVLGSLVRPLNCPYVISLHGSDVLHIANRSLLHATGAKLALRRADLITSPAQHMTDRLDAFVGADKPILTAQYGVDTTCFHPPPVAARRSPICVSTRAMDPIYNVETTLLAARTLEEIGSPLQLHLANEGPLYSELRRRAADLGLQSRVRFLGRIGQDEIAAALRSAAVYVSTSLSDGASLSLLEAMACGSFPVVSDIAANREWITDGLNGYLVPAHSPRALALRCREAWRNRELRQAAARRNWELIDERANYTKNMKLMESTFLRLVRSVHPHDGR